MKSQLDTMASVYVVILGTFCATIAVAAPPSIGAPKANSAKVAIQDVSDFQVHIDAADAYVRLGETKLAIETYEEAFELAQNPNERSSVADRLKAMQVQKPANRFITAALDALTNAVPILLLLLVVAFAYGAAMLIGRFRRRPEALAIRSRADGIPSEYIAGAIVSVIERLQSEFEKHQHLSARLKLSNSVQSRFPLIDGSRIIVDADEFKRRISVLHDAGQFTLSNGWEQMLTWCPNVYRSAKANFLLEVSMLSAAEGGGIAARLYSHAKRELQWSLRSDGSDMCERVDALAKDVVATMHRLSA
jgi:tetratricopeptide (TPR) repeat protein